MSLLSESRHNPLFLSTPTGVYCLIEDSEDLIMRAIGMFSVVFRITRSRIQFLISQGLSGLSPCLARPLVRNSGSWHF